MTNSKSKQIKIVIIFTYGKSSPATSRYQKLNKEISAKSAHWVGLKALAKHMAHMPTMETVATIVTNSEMKTFNVHAVSYQSTWTTLMDKIKHGGEKPSENIYN